MEKNNPLDPFREVADSLKNRDELPTDISPLVSLLDITDSQLALFSMFLTETLNGNTVSLSEVVKMMNKQPFEVFDHVDDLKHLLSKKYLALYKERPLFGKDEYYVNKRTIQSICDGKFQKTESDEMELFEIDDLRDNKRTGSKTNDISTEHFDKGSELLYNMGMLIRSMNSNDEQEQVLVEMSQMMAANPDNDLVRFMKSNPLTIEEQFTLVFLCFSSLWEEPELNFMRLNAFLEFNSKQTFWLKKAMLDKKSFLFTEQLVDIKMAKETNHLDNSQGGLKPFLYATSKALKMAYGTEYDEFSILKSNVPVSDCILPETIPFKTMVYNEQESKDVALLEQVLSPERLPQIQDRLSKKGLRRGVAILLMGAPGTGKTETVRQIAKKTGRKVLALNISDFKGMYYGESEQNLKAVFESYRQQVSANDDNFPILLLNEADSMLSKRRTQLKSSSDMSDNALQNIFLEELENLNGLLIATTNLATNLDPAFHRRFLYKLTISNPDASARESIWRSQIPELDATTAHQLALKHPLSGGQIENVARKCVTSLILQDTLPSPSELDRLCRQELIFEHEKIKVGFVQ